MQAPVWVGVPLNDEEAFNAGRYGTMHALLYVRVHVVVHVHVERCWCWGSVRHKDPLVEGVLMSLGVMDCVIPRGGVGDKLRKC